MQQTSVGSFSCQTPVQSSVQMNKYSFGAYKSLEEVVGDQVNLHGL